MLLSTTLWVGYFIYFKLTRVFWYLMFLMDSSASIKEIKRLIRKRMSNIYYWEELTFSKLSFSRKENLKKVTNFENQKGTRYIRQNVYIDIIVFSCYSSTKLFFRFLLNCFVREINKKLPENFQQKGWVFTDIMNVSLNILAKN